MLLQLVFTLFVFYKGRFVFQTSRAIYWKHLKLEAIYHAAPLASGMFKALFSDMYSRCTFHSEGAGVLTRGQQLAGDAKLEVDVRKLTCKNVQ